MKATNNKSIQAFLVAAMLLVLGFGCLPAQKHSSYRSIHEYARDGDLADVQAVLVFNTKNLNFQDYLTTHLLIEED